MELRGTGILKEKDRIDGSRFLESRDRDFDTCRVFLIISMIIAHAFEGFYQPDFNRQLTAFVTVGFVFLAGFTTSTIYADRMATESLNYFGRFLKPSIKLTVLFFVCNVGKFIVKRNILSTLVQYTPMRVVQSVVLGLDQNLFGFGILIPISFTIFLSWFLLSIQSRIWSLPLAGAFFIVFWISEHWSLFNYFGIKFVLVGLIGSLMGKWVSGLSWKSSLLRLSALGINTGSGIFIFCYYLMLLFWSGRGSHLNFSVHLLPTIILLYLVYVISLKLRLARLIALRMLAETLSKHMLFAYIFHIGLLNLLCLVISKKGLDLLSTAEVSLFVLGVTVATCYLLNRANKKWVYSQALYNVVFR